jgi:hypothetical protein
MQNRIEKCNWKFDHDISMNKLSAKDKFKKFAKKYLGITLGYKNYKLT